MSQWIVGSGIDFGLYLAYVPSYSLCYRMIGLQDSLNLTFVLRTLKTEIVQDKFHAPPVIDPETNRLTLKGKWIIWPGLKRTSSLPRPVWPAIDGVGAGPDFEMTLRNYGTPGSKDGPLWESRVLQVRENSWLFGEHFTVQLTTNS